MGTEVKYVLFKCNLCLETFLIPDDIEDHLKHHSKENWPFLCAYCGYGDVSGEQITYHCKETHQGKELMRGAL